MKIPVKKLKNGFEMPVFGIGTWMMGGDVLHDPTNDDQADIRAIREAIELGVTHIDSSEAYANGYSEILVSKAIKNYSRKELFIATKVWPLNLHYKDVIKSAKRSLERLATDYIDLYIIHYPNPGIPVEESMAALDLLADTGLIRNMGLSNFNKKQFIEAQKYAKHTISSNQVHYNLIHREYEKNSFIEYAKSIDIMIVAWRPIQEGILSGSREGKIPDIMTRMCKKYEKTPVQIALNWLISQKNVVTLAKSRNIAHLKENLGALGWNMETRDIEEVRKYFPGQKDYSDSTEVDIYRETQVMHSE